MEMEYGCKSPPPKQDPKCRAKFCKCGTLFHDSINFPRFQCGFCKATEIARQKAKGAPV